jgi:hypothetical protein
MSRRKKPLTLAEHQAIGDRLHTIRTTLGHIAVWIGNTYRHDKMRYVVRVEKQLDRIRCQLDNHVSAEFPRLPNRECCQVYYPGALKAHDLPQTEWDVAMICERFAVMATDLRLIADQLFQAYPVALGDRLLRCAELLAFEAIELPYHLGTPKRRWG